MKAGKVLILPRLLYQELAQKVPIFAAKFEMIFDLLVVRKIVAGFLLSSCQDSTGQKWISVKFVHTVDHMKNFLKNFPQVLNSWKKISLVKFREFFNKKVLLKIFWTF